MDGFFSFAEAWNQTGLMIGGLVLIGLGGLLAGDWVYKRKKAMRCQATIVGVREKSSKNGGMYYPVVEYFSKELGENVQAETDMGSSSLKGKEPGTKVAILVMPGKPKEVTIEGRLTLILGLILMAPGFVMGYFALTKYSFSIWTIILPLLLIGLLASKLLGVMKKGGKGFGFRRAPVSKYAVQDDATVPASTDAGATSPESPGIAGKQDIKSALFAALEQKQSKSDQKSELLDAAGFAKKKRERAGQMRKAGPFIMLVGLVFLGIGIWLTQDLVHMLEVGQRADGKVVRLEESYSSSSSGGSSYTYYPIVAFTVPDTGERIEFKDNMGSNPPAYDSGEEVTVLYDPANPKTEAIIDKGIWNWVAPGLCTGIGALVFLFSLGGWIRARRAAERF